jgi:hypothetical protein
MFIKVFINSEGHIIARHDKQQEVTYPGCTAWLIDSANLDEDNNYNEADLLPVNKSWTKELIIERATAIEAREGVDVLESIADGLTRKELMIWAGVNTIKKDSPLYVMVEDVLARAITKDDNITQEMVAEVFA